MTAFTTALFLRLEPDAWPANRVLLFPRAACILIGLLKAYAIAIWVFAMRLLMLNDELSSPACTPQT